MMATLTFNELNFPAVTDNYLFYKIFNDRINPFPANICVFKVSNKNTKKICEICSKLPIEIPEQRK